MGELLRFPAAGRSPQDGAGPRSAGSRSAGSASAPDGVHEEPAAFERITDLESRPRSSGAVEAAGEPRWAVPGVDDQVQPIAEPTRAARRAANVAVAALARHDASEAEMRARLVAKELDEPAVEAELERLRGAGLLDDLAFARRQIERLRERKGLGDAAIRSALRGRMVPQPVIDAVLAEQAEDVDDAQQRLQEVADDRARRLGGLAADVAERRLIAYLMRRGFGGGEVRTAARSALDRLGRR